jgi:O-antigen/teichoic acid export membrane protein
VRPVGVAREQVRETVVDEVLGGGERPPAEAALEGRRRDLHDRPLRNQPFEKLGPLLHARVPFGMREDGRQARRPDPVDCSADRDGPAGVRELQQDVLAKGCVAEAEELLVAEPAQLDEVDLPARDHVDRDARLGDGGADARERVLHLARTRRIVMAHMRCRGDDRDSVRRGRLCQLDRFLQRTRSVVQTRKDVRMEVDHGGQDTSAASGRRAGLARNIAYALATQVAGSVFTAALTLFLVRSLGPRDFGRFSLTLAIAGVLTLPTDLGLSASAARFIAERRSDRKRTAATFAEAFWTKLTIATVVAVALVAAAGPIARGFGDGGLAWPLRGMALALLGQSMLLLVLQSFVALQQTSTNLWVVTAESAIETLASVALVLGGGGAAGAAFGRTIGYAVGAAIGLGFVARKLGPDAFHLRAPHRIGEVVRYARSLAVVDWAFAAFEQIDQLLIGLLLTTRAVGSFGAPLRLAALLHYPGYAIANGVVPRLARTGAQQPDTAAFVRALRILFVIQAALTAPLVAWAQPITALLLGTAYSQADDVLRALAPYVFLSGLAPLVSLGANYLGEARRRPRIAVSTLALNVVIDVVLLRKIGIVAAAIGTDVAFVLYVAAHVALCTRALELRLRPLLVGLGRSLAAGAAACGVLALVGTSHLALWQWAVGAPAAVLAFAAVLAASGELRAIYPSRRPAGTVAVEP